MDTLSTEEVAVREIDFDVEVDDALPLTETAALAVEALNEMMLDEVVLHWPKAELQPAPQ